MCEMSKASEISQNVYLGPTPDPSLIQISNPLDNINFNVFIETTDLAQVPESHSLEKLKETLEGSNQEPLHMEFPSSGSIMPPTWSQTDVDGLMAMCNWIYSITHFPSSEDNSPTSTIEDVSKDSDGDSIMLSTFPSRSTSEKKILIHCTDGYTETSLLALAYFMYAEGLPVHEAWVRLHREKGRNFFAYPSDVALLTSIQPRILQESPVWNGDILHINEPAWLSKIDGSLPSRILPYMYLGNLCHANNPTLLQELGITRILSVGEPVTWSKEVLDDWGQDNLLFIDRVQDNGVDPLTDEFERCLKFIERGKRDGTATLVHCRVGVSRSATICIAEVMNELGLSFPRA
jgi:dual specificity MAP kinase phosphatase